VSGPGQKTRAARRKLAILSGFGVERQKDRITCLRLVDPADDRARRTMIAKSFAGGCGDWMAVRKVEGLLKK
jgi:hypothetical protein